MHLTLPTFSPPVRRRFLILVQVPVALPKGRPPRPPLAARLAMRVWPHILRAEYSAVRRSGCRVLIGRPRAPQRVALHNSLAVRAERSERGKSSGIGMLPANGARDLATTRQWVVHVPLDIMNSGNRGCLWSTRGASFIAAAEGRTRAGGNEIRGNGRKLKNKT